MWWIRAKRERITDPSGKEYVYYVNPTKSELEGLIFNKGAQFWGSKINGRLNPTLMVRGLLSGEELGVPGDLYIWNPYLIIHRDFARMVGVKKYVSVYLTKYEVCVSTAQGDKRYWPISIKSFSDMEEFIMGSEMMENIYGKNFSVVFKEIY